MIVGLVVVLGAIVGLMCFVVKGSGYGLPSDVILGISGSIIGSFIMTAAYTLNYLGKANIIGLNWYSITIGTIGALVMIYSAWLYKGKSLISKIGFNIIKIK